MMIFSQHSTGGNHLTNRKNTFSSIKWFASLSFLPFRAFFTEKEPFQQKALLFYYRSLIKYVFKEKTVIHTCILSISNISFCNCHSKNNFSLLFLFVYYFELKYTLKYFWMDMLLASVYF